MTEIGIVGGGVILILWYVLMARGMHKKGQNLIELDEVDRFLGIAKTGVTASGIALVLLVNANVSRSLVSPWKVKAAPIFLLFSVVLGLVYMVVLSRQFQLYKRQEEGGAVQARIPPLWWHLINSLSLGGLYLFVLGLCAVADIVLGLPSPGPRNPGH